MPPSMDVFDGSAFNTRTLTAAVNNMDYVPGQVSSLGLFNENGVATTRIMVERRGQTVALVPTTPRGGPGTANNIDKRNMVSLEIPHLQIDDAVVADEVQGVREFGQESNLRTVQSLVNEKQARMVRNLDMTMEYHRLGALKGIVLDADGVTELFDYYTAFNEAAPAVENFDLDNATPASGALAQSCANVVRKIQEALGGLMYQRIHCLCGSTFHDQFIRHPEYRETYLNQPEAQVLRAGIAYSQFTFGGITFEEYRGPSSGPAFIAATEARFFPIGAPDLFITRFAPADYEDTVNTIGLPRYSDQRPDPNAPRKRRIIEVQSNPIHICTRPRVLVEGINT